MLKLLWIIKEKISEIKYNMFTGYSVKQDIETKNFMREYLKTADADNYFTPKEKDYYMRMSIK